MVDYNIAVPQPYDPSNDIANALRFRAQQQAEAENQLKTQAWLEDRAYTLKQREAAAANALAARAKAADIASIYGNFGTTDRAVGTRGLSATGENMSADPYEYLRNQLLKKGYRGEATDVAEFQNKLLTGKKTQAEINNFNTENATKIVALHGAQLKEYADAVLRASSIPEVNMLIDSHADVLAKLGIPPEQAKKNFADLVDKVGFQQAIMQSSQGAMATQKHLADTGLVNAQTKKENALTAETKARTTGILSDNDKKAVDARAAKIKEYGDAILRAGSYDEVNALIDSHADIFKDLGLTTEQAKQNFRNMAEDIGFTRALINVALGAKERQAHVANIAETKAKSVSIENTDQGLALVDKTNGSVTPLSLNDKPLMGKTAREAMSPLGRLIAERDALPVDSPLRAQYDAAIKNETKTGAAHVSDLGRLIAERDALPPNSPLRAIYDEAIAKATGGVTPAKTEASIASAQDAIGQIDELLAHPGFGEAVGAGWGTSRIPGSSAKGAIALHNQITGGAFLDAYNYLRGTGSITEIEGKKATAARARMDLDTSEDDYIKAAKEYQAILRRGIEREKARLKGGGAATPSSTSGTTSGGITFTIQP